MPIAYRLSLKKNEPIFFVAMGVFLGRIYPVERLGFFICHVLENGYNPNFFFDKVIKNLFLVA